MTTPVQQEYLAPDAPAILSPGPGAGIGGTIIPFFWASPTLNVDTYRLTVGSTQDGTEYHDSGQITHTTENVVGIPYGVPGIYVTLYFTNSSETRLRRYQYVGAHPSILLPTEGSEQPIGNVPVKWTPNDPTSDFDVTIAGVESGTVYMSLTGLTSTETFWRPSVQDILPQDVNFTATVKWNSAPLTLINNFKLHSLPALGLTVDGKVPTPRAYSIPSTLTESTETLKFPTTINLFRDGRETRFTTSEVPLFSQKFTSALPGVKQNEFMHYVREAGRQHTWFPAVSHTLCGSVLGNTFTLGPEQHVTWLWDVAPKLMVIVPSTEQYLVVSLTSINANGTLTLGMGGFSDTATGAKAVRVCPCFVQVPDFMEVSHAGRESSAAKVAGMPIAIPFQPNTEGSLAYNVSGFSVIPILSPFSSRKFVQLLEGTPATHSPEYYPIGEQAVDLSSYTYVWTNADQLKDLVVFFCKMKGAQNSFILTDYMATLPVKEVPSTTEIALSYASDKEKPVASGFKYLVVLKGQEPISVHKIVSFSFSSYAMIVTLDNPLSAEAQDKLLSCEYSLCEGLATRFTDSELTMTHQAHGRGSASLSFTEVIQ